MAAQKFNFMFLLFVSSCATASNTEPVKLNNQLSACIATTNMKISMEGRIPVLSFDLQMIKHLGECGCKSALGSYTVYSQMEEYTSYIIGGKAGFAKSAHKYLPLAAEQNLIDKRKLIVDFSCAQPD